MAGKDDFIYPPEHQAELAAHIPNSRLKLIERAGHNPHDEQTADVMKELRAFIPADVGARVPSSTHPRSREVTAGALFSGVLRSQVPQFSEHPSVGGGVTTRPRGLGALGRSTR